MTLTRNMRWTSVPLTLVLSLCALALPAIASGGSEQRGARVLSGVQAGRLTATNLTSAQYQGVGQYLMHRALGSARRHEAMDSLMDRVMGQSVADQMYLYMGERYLGKSVSPNSSYTPYYGWMAEMMTRYSGSWAGMMGGYMIGAYRDLSGAGGVSNGGMMGPALTPRGAQNGYPLAPSMMNRAHRASGGSSSGGWSIAATVAVTLLATLLGVGALVLLRPRLRRGEGSGTPAARHG